jgi:hypothetical protein
VATTFAEVDDVEEAYEGTISESGGRRVQYLLDTLSARLRLLLADLPARIDADESGDLALAAKDVVVQAAIRRMGGTTQQVRSESEGIGPFSRTLTYTTDKSGTFPDEDLALLGGASVVTSGTVGTSQLRRPDWYAWGAM